jgi:hypothetical protein
MNKPGCHRQRQQGTQSGVHVPGLSYDFSLKGRGERSEATRGHGEPVFTPAYRLKSKRQPRVRSAHLSHQKARELAHVHAPAILAVKLSQRE